MPTAAEIARAEQHFQEVTGGKSPSDFGSIVQDFINQTGRVPSGNDLQNFSQAQSVASGGIPGFPSTITTRQETIIPDFLKPIIRARHDRTLQGNEALQDLEDFIQRGIRDGTLVAPLNEDQLAALQQSRDFAGSEGLAQALGAIRSTAAGEQLQGQGGLDILRMFAGVPGSSSGGGGIPSASGVGAAVPRGLFPVDTTEGFTGSGSAPTAGGQAGPGVPPGVSSQGFQNAFEAAVRRAQPGIFNQFARAGRTGSGLAQTAQTQAQADAFAGLFNQQQARQFGAAQTLANLFNNERGRQLNAAQVFPQLGQVPAQILGRVGDVRQQQAQRERTAPLQALENFAQVAAGSAVPVPIGSLVGSTTTQPNVLQPTALIQNLTAAGISPSSPQGQQIILNAIQGGAGGGGGGSAGGGFGGALTGGLGGAAAGAQIGSVVPGLGTAVGAGVGGVIGLLGGGGFL